MPKHLHQGHLGEGLSFDGTRLVASVAGPQAFCVFIPGDVSSGYAADVMLSMPQAGNILSTTTRSTGSSGTALLLKNGVAATDQFQIIDSSGSTLIQNIAVAQGDRIGVSIAVANFNLANVTYQVTWTPGG